MRKRVIFPILSFFCAVGVFLRVFYLVSMTQYVEDSADVAVIGGADKPTEDFMVSRMAVHDPMIITFTIAGIISLVIFGIFLISEHKKRK